jgi:hypothetical protein
MIKKKKLDWIKFNVSKQIDSLPRTTSYYLSAYTKIEYIDSSLTVFDMYKLYIRNKPKWKWVRLCTPES